MEEVTEDRSFDLITGRKYKTSMDYERTFLLHRHVPRYNGLLNDYTGSVFEQSELD